MRRRHRCERKRGDVVAVVAVVVVVVAVVVVVISSPVVISTAISLAWKVVTFA